VTRSTKILIPVALAAAAIVAFYFMVLAPKRDEVAKLDTDIAAQQSQVDQSRALAATYLDAKRRYTTNYTTLVRLGKAVPADDDVRSLLVQISDAAARAKVDFRALNVGSGGGSAAATETTASGTLAPPPGTVPVGSAGFSAMPFSFGFEGSYFRLSDFLDRLEDFVTVTNKKVDVTGRLMLVGSISISTKEELKRLSAQIGAATYLVPPAQGIDGATSPTPATSGQGAAPPADGGTTPSTSATITGVR
jgi:hypothetical protein